MEKSQYTPVSIFDIFKIGIGPSSSHTMGPWRAALDFVSELRGRNLLEKVTGIQVELLGSLCKTGKGHGTDMGVQMGLCGELPDAIDPWIIPDRLREIRERGRIPLPVVGGEVVEVSFAPERDIRFVWKVEDSAYLEGDLLHPNTLFFAALFDDKDNDNNGKNPVFHMGYHSVGGGFIERRGGGYPPSEETRNFPYPIQEASDIMDYHQKTGMNLDGIVWANEASWKSDEEIRDFLKEISLAMIESIYRGCHTEGVLEGGLKVTRRGARVYRSIIDTLPESVKAKEPPYDPGGKSIQGWISFIRESGHRSFPQVVNWVIAFALSVNEENAAFGRIVTAPTNGAAGVIPAVLFYHICFSEHLPAAEEIGKFLLCAGEIGSLFKKGSTISAAAGGCQAEIGVSSSMAAAALTAVRGGDMQQVFMAAEIAMEHHLGLTCDPIGGLVQVPCIERNTMGAIKAITASQLALVSEPGKNVVQLDDVINTMWNTARDMNEKYKETSEGGLATTVSVNVPEC